MFFEIIGKITEIELIARGAGVDSRGILRVKYGVGDWRKLKGKVRVRLQDGSERKAEVHWYEAHSVGKKEVKIKKFLD